MAFSANTYSKTQPNGTDIFLADLKINNENIEVSNAFNITEREGYDNQPSFIPDETGILFSSVREDKQADIYMYNILEKKISKITNTSESEYSPTIMADRNLFSTVRVESDSTQRLWKFPLNGGEPELILTNILPVGYHCWINPTNLALFILGEKNTLQIYNMQKGNLNNIEGDIGRSLQKIPGEDALSYVHKINEKKWEIKQLNLPSMKVKTLISTLPNSEDIAWTPNKILLMGHGSKLYKWNPKTDKSWKQTADLSNYGVKEILRLSVSPSGKKLAFVSNIENKK